MEKKDIPIQHLGGDIPESVRELRMKSPDFLAALCLPLHELEVLTDIKDIEDIPAGNVSVLRGGVSSACYLIKQEGAAKNVVLKMRNQGVDAEAEWLKKTGEKGVAVPEVRSYGVIPGQEKQLKPAKYIVLNAIENPTGKLAKEGFFYRNNPEELRTISTQMGLELAKIHKIVSDRGFGTYADMWRANNPAKTWREYLEHNLQENLLFEQGIAQEKKDMVVAEIRSIQFPEKGVYLHGDFGLHNVLVSSIDPLNISIIDPNPLIGDPYFDLALQYNRMELKEAKHLGEKNNQHYLKEWEIEQVYFENLMNAYKKATGEEIDIKRLAANQLITLMQSIRYEQSFDKSKLTVEQKTKKELEIRIKQQLLRRKVEILIQDKKIKTNSTPITSFMRKLFRS